MPRKAIVHIGPMKTGSSSIQSWMQANRTALLEAGVLIPASLGEANMSRLSYMAQVIAANEEVTELDGARLAALRKEITGLPDTVGTVVFSGEMLGNQLRRPLQLRAFKEILDEFFDEYRIVLYLRRQDELSLSRYSTALRHGFKSAQPLASPIDYEKILNAWAKTFGRDAMQPRLFDRKVMPEGDVVRDFAGATGLPLIGLGEEPIRRNSSVLPEAQAFLIDLATRVRASGFSKTFLEVPGREVISRHLVDKFGGKGMKPSRTDALAFYEPMRAANERVRASWFPELTTLFSEDFSDYADQATVEPSADKVRDVAMSVLIALVTRSPADGEAGIDAEEAIRQRKIREKNEMRDRRQRLRKVRARRRRKRAAAEGL